jgi:hypothetical protein
LSVKNGLQRRLCGDLQRANEKRTGDEFSVAHFFYLGCERLREEGARYRHFGPIKRVNALTSNNGQESGSGQ